MNFETKYLIRWGIPGWIMIMNLLPYFIVIYLKPLTALLTTTTPSYIITLGAVLTGLGVPLGYLLNQIHHSLTWVLPKLIKKEWDSYFDEEIKVDNYIDNHPHAPEKKDRYRYLLSRKHELGGFTVSLGISTGVIGLTNILGHYHHAWCWWYFVIETVLFVIIYMSRQYSSRNIEKYHTHYLNNGA